MIQYKSEFSVYPEREKACNTSVYLLYKPDIMSSQKTK